MLLVFLAVYIALGIGCIVGGVRRQARTAVTLGAITLALAIAFLSVWALLALGVRHWTVSVLQAFLSPMPESLLQPDALSAIAAGLPTIAVAAIELIVAIGLWAIPVAGLALAGRSPSRQST